MHYCYVVTALSNIYLTDKLLGPVTRMGHSNSEILCTDADKDGYYSWGIGPDAAVAAELCTSTLGTVTTALCCTSVTDFPNMCLAGACGCAPASSHTINRCNCGSACFMPGLGCVGAASVCTIGADQTCNDDPSVSSIRGRCVEGGRCVCLMGSGMNASTGKCR